MEVILTKDVDSLGIKNEIVKVKDGYARNYLLKNKLAIIATEGNRKNLQRQIEKARELREKRLSEARLMAERLSKLSLNITKKSGKEGKLYGSVTSQEIADLLEAASGNPIDKRKLVLPHQLKSVGSYNIVLKLEPGVTAEVKLEVLPEEPLEGFEAEKTKEAVSSEKSETPKQSEAPKEEGEGDEDKASAKQEDAEKSE